MPNSHNQFPELPDHLTESHRSYKPFKYQWAYEAWEIQQKIHWLPEEVPMADDIKDWKHKLNDDERELCESIFRFFTQADIDVNDCYMQKYSNVFKPIEIQMMLAAFSNMETIHVAAYSHLVDTIGMGEGFYEEFYKYKEMCDKHDYMQKFGVETESGSAKTMAVFGAFTEGLQLFASFAILLNFQRFNKMKGMGQIISWSIRDETLHCQSIVKLFRTFIEEKEERDYYREVRHKQEGNEGEFKSEPLWCEAFKHDLYDACGAIVHFEDAFIDLAFYKDPEKKEGHRDIEGLTAAEVKKYIRYIADIRLTQLGLKPMYLIDKNPLSWIDEIMSGMDHTNFFENRVTEYSKSSTKGQWDDSIYED